MFCEKCGVQLVNGATFCTNCGAKVNSNEGPNPQIMEKRPIEDNEVQLHVKPTYKFGYKVMPTIVWYWAIMLMILIPFLIFFGLGLGLVVFVSQIVIFILYGVFYGIGVAVCKKQYDKYSYDFYKTKVIYRDSFLNVSEKEVKYKYIREVGMNQTFFQKFFNLGNISLHTNAEMFGNGIFIRDVENVDEVYSKIRKIIEV